MTAKSSWRISLVATLILGAAMLIARVFLAAPVPSEMFFNFSGRLLGVPWVFNLIHQLPLGLDAYAKYALYAVSTLFILALWFVAGFYVLRSQLKHLYNLIIFPLGSALLVGIVLFPLQGLGVFGLSDSNYAYPPLEAHLWAAGFGLVFAGLLLALKAAFTSSGVTSNAVDETRRKTLKALLLSPILVGSVAGLSQMLINGWARAQDAITGFIEAIKGISPEVTPTGEHYVVSKNVFNPSVDEKSWKLRITGMVDKELNLDLEGIKALPSVERTSTLTCISNQVGGDLIGNSLWTGVMLKDVLEMAGVQANANELILKAADNYTDSFPLDDAMRDATIIAYWQNGEPLTRDHGFPARVLVPGIYGMKNVKWVTEIELSNQDYQGYWQTRGWSDVATVQTMSRIDTNTATKLADGSYAIGGVTFAGIRGVSKVEVSLDEGASWQEASLKPAINDLSWNLWGFSWQPEPGTHMVWVRATDGTGTTQPEKRTNPLPDGATGYHMIKVKVA